MSAGDVASAARSAGFSGDGLRTAIAIADAESGYNAGARATNTDGSIDRGAWQINSRWHPEVSDACAFDLACSAKAAFRISNSGSNWTPWSTWGNGAWRQHLAEAGAFVTAAVADARTAGWTNPFPDLSQCTAWVAKMAHDVWGTTIPNWGNAGSWLDGARKSGYAVRNPGDAPRVGDIAVWTPGHGGAFGAGHVAMVTGITPGGVVVSEQNWPENSGPHNGRIVSVSDISGFIMPHILAGTVTSYPWSQAINRALGGAPEAVANSSANPVNWSSIPDALNWMRDHLWNMGLMIAGSALVLIGVGLYKSDTAITLATKVA